MKAGLKNFLTTVLAFLVPIISTLVLILILFIPRDNSYWNFLRQAPFYAGIYFWQSQRPDIFTFFSAFILGVLADVFGSTPLGINIISFLVLYMIATQISQHFNVKRFSYSWLLFAASTFLTLLFKATIVSGAYRHLIPFNLLAIEWLLIVASYPLFARIYIWTERRYIHLEERYEKVQS